MPQSKTARAPVAAPAPPDSAPPAAVEAVQAAAAAVAAAPHAVTLRVRYRDRHGNEIEREERTLTVVDGRAELVIDHMTRAA